jgi:hypothetical protein
MNVVRYVDREDLMARRYEELTKPTFPEYMNQSEAADLYWGRLYTDFADFQVASSTAPTCWPRHMPSPSPGTERSTTCPRAGRTASCVA